MRDNYSLRIFTGNANPDLAARIARELRTPLGEITVKHFSDGEICVQIEESARGQDIFIVQPTCYPVNDNLMELMIMIDAFRRASASRITVVLPYYGYARQDKKIKPREAVTARLVANMITQAGASRVLCVDLHAGQIQGFFDLPVDHLYAGPLIADYMIANGLHNGNICVVSPRCRRCCPRPRSCRASSHFHRHHCQASPGSQQSRNHGTDRGCQRQSLRDGG